MKNPRFLLRWFWTNDGRHTENPLMIAHHNRWRNLNIWLAWAVIETADNFIFIQIRFDDSWLDSTLSSHFGFSHSSSPATSPNRINTENGKIEKNKQREGNLPAPVGHVKSSVVETNSRRHQLDSVVVLVGTFIMAWFRLRIIVRNHFYASKWLFLHKMWMWGCNGWKNCQTSILLHSPRNTGSEWDASSNIFCSTQYRQVCTRTFRNYRAIWSFSCVSLATVFGSWCPSLFTGVHEILGSKAQCLFCLKLPPQRGEGEKREGVQILKQSTQNLWHQN